MHAVDSPIGYLVSRYPAVSHTFVLHEVAALRERGVAIHTFSIRRAHREHLLTAADRAAAETTTAILPPSPRHFLRAHLAALTAAPAAYLRTLLRAIRRGESDLRAVLWQCFYFAESIVLWSHCAERAIRHVHVHLANPAADVALLAADFGSRTGREGVRSWSFTMHGPTEFSDVRRHRLAEKVADARFVVCISDFARSQLMAVSDPRDWPKLTVVHCGIDTDGLAVAGGRESAGLRVVCVGRLVPEKGQAVLVEAIARLREEGVEADLTLVGDGPGRRTLEEQVRRHALAPAVTFTGAVSHADVKRRLAAADVFCLASFAEGVPVVLMEAMGSGLPVVTTRVMGIPELVSDGIDGILVRPGRADELADALRELADPGRRAELGGAARAKVEREFSLPSTAAQLHEVFARCLGITRA
jgi:colanic acid/amylovoran biosynthesis glycosyltransferase